jgi:hypothetical protein
MGLAVSVNILDQLRERDEEGYAYCRSQFDKLQAYLASEGYAGYVEPEHVDARLPLHVGSFPYGFLHRLRRVWALVRRRQPVTPCPSDFDPNTDELLDEEYTLFMDSHLVCHSDAEGYYVPVDFADVLYPDEALGLTGGMVGSSYALLRELLIIAPGLGIAVGEVDEGELARIANVDATDPLSPEKVVWLALFLNARASIRHRTAIVFN